MYRLADNSERLYSPSGPPQRGDSTGATENAGVNANVQRIAGIGYSATVLPPCKKAMVHLQKHKPYNFLHCMPIDFATSEMWSE